MSPRVKLYIKLILVEILKWGLIYLITHLLTEGDLFTYMDTVVFSLSISINLIFSYYSYTKALKKLGITKLTDEILSTTQSKEFVSNMTPSELVSALKREEHFKRMVITASQNIIKLRLPKKWYRFNFYIVDIEFERKLQSSTKYSVVSRLNSYSYIISSIHSHRNILSITKIFEMQKQSFWGIKFPVFG